MEGVNIQSIQHFLYAGTVYTKSFADAYRDTCTSNVIAADYEVTYRGGDATKPYIVTQCSISWRNARLL